MMNKYFSLAVVAAAISFASCKKVVSPVPMGDAGNTIVRVMSEDYETEKPGGYQFVSLKASSQIQPFDVVDIRRALPNNDALNTTLNVQLREDPSAITTFNSIHGTSFIPLPGAYYAANNINPKSGTDFTVTFNPGEFSKFLKIDFVNVNGWDLSKSYAMAFTVIGADNGAQVTQDVQRDTGNRISSYNRTIVVEIGPRNIWDGIYELRGYILRATFPEQTGTVGPKEIGLVTTGTYSVRYDRSHGWANQSAIGLAASVAYPTYTIDPGTNLVDITSDGGAFPAGLTNATTVGTPRYDPGAKTFYAYATWNAAGVSGRLMSDTLVYLRDR
jgi:hypothetical protein